MCGIVGYVGSQQAAPILLQGLRRLEYRGYDSAGLCGINGHLYVHRAQGRVADLENRLEEGDALGTIGLGHTRWATHGVPSDENAHPHLDCLGTIAVVHNGIIENYQELRSDLRGRGHVFSSDTDTEVVSHLIEEHYQGDLVAAVFQALEELQGSFALGVLAQDSPTELVVARQDSPLVIGIGDEQNYIASDIPAILDHTRRVHILEDGELARVTATSVEVYSRGGGLIDKPVAHVHWSPLQAEKEGYEDFMLKEIHEQPQAIRQTLAGRVLADGLVDLSSEIPASVWEGITSMELVACGTAYHACLYGKHLLEEYLELPVSADIASEYRYRRGRADKNTLLIVISQSGETADTLGAMRRGRSTGARVLAITNVVGSTLAREADAVLQTHAGPEIAVASTKAYTTQLACCWMLAVYLKEQLRGIGDKSDFHQLMQIPDQIEAILAADEDRLERYAKRFQHSSSAFYLGRGLDLVSAMEGQLKLKEISYIHGEALAAGELKHGTLALIEDGVPVVALLTQQSLVRKMLSNLKEVQARGGDILALALCPGQCMDDLDCETVLLPDTHPFLSPLLTVIPMQVLAYYVAKWRGCDVDKPRNLAKSVTVE